MPALGGVARRATLIDQERQAHAFVLVLDAGDSLTGDQDPALKTQGQTSVEAMNRMGYDAMVLGPADLGLGVAALRQRSAEAKFAMVSANAVLTGTMQLLAKPYLLRELAGHRVAIVGLSGGGGTAEIGVLDPLATARKIVPEVRQQADVVILLSHAGPAVDQADRRRGAGHRGDRQRRGRRRDAGRLGEPGHRRADLPCRPGDGGPCRPRVGHRQAGFRRERQAQGAGLESGVARPGHRRRSGNGRVGTREETTVKETSHE